MKILSVLAKMLDFCRNAPFHIKTRICLKYFVNEYGCSDMGMDGFRQVTASSS